MDNGAYVTSAGQIFALPFDGGGHGEVLVDLKEREEERQHFASRSVRGGVKRYAVVRMVGIGPSPTVGLCRTFLPLKLNK